VARIDWIEQRLQNWARWRLMRGAGVLGYAAVDLTELADSDAGRDGYITASVPVSDVEASDTDDLVQRLASELKAAVEIIYLGTGTIREKAARLFCAVGTLHARIEQAQRVMADHLLARQDRRRGERERVEQLQRACKR